MRRLAWLLALTTAFEGLRAGAGVFRVLLDLPARHAVGPVAFAHFSQATDLSRTGVIFYVVYGFGGALLTGATWVAAVRARAASPIKTLAGLACLCSLSVLGLTAKAAPLMWRVGSSPDDAALLGDLLDRFTFWTTARIGCVAVSFVAVLSAMTLMALKGAATKTA